MKTLYFECNMGAAGDMLMAALLELCPDRNAFLEQMNSLGLARVKVELDSVAKCGIFGSQINVTIDNIQPQGGQDMEISQDVSIQDHEHEHSHDHDHDHGHEHSHDHNGLDGIEHILSSLNISEQVKENALAVYQLIAAAEAKAHNRPVTEVHFHEVGNLDAIADIVGVCILMEQLSPEQVIVSPIHVGSGFVRCAHGILPVPAPATAHILINVPVYSGQIKGELCTPTGAALLKHFATSFGSMPEMRVHKIGYGMGHKDFPAANCVRVFAGRTTSGSAHEPNGYVEELNCNIDDMSGEALGYACRTLIEAGAHDVFIQQIQMKKDRPGHLLSVICATKDVDRLASLILKHTTTIGVRRLTMQRYSLDRQIKTHDTPLGTVRIKQSEGYGVERLKVEYDDLAELAKAHNLSFDEISRLVNSYINNK